VSIDGVDQNEHRRCASPRPPMTCRSGATYRGAVPFWREVRCSAFVGWRVRRALSMLTINVLYMRAIVALALPALADVIVPAWLLSGPGGRIDIGAFRFLGVPLILAGCWLLLDSVFVRFAHEGRGTLAPIDPPRFIVRGGAYRVVRNPMYLANLTIVVGSGILFQSWFLFVWAAVLFVAFHLFVITYEEPTLSRLFGDKYQAYRREVGRWTPRLPRRRRGDP
jgi:protein-S-isoprenylcysteine O-methyltransferase Ste14